MLRKIFPLLIMVLIVSCGDDDNDVEIVPPRLLADQVIEDDAAIQEYLATHFFNYEDFENPPVDFNNKITIDSIIQPDGRVNKIDLDSDGDGILDIVEAQVDSLFIAPTFQDDDGDGLDNAYEGELGNEGLTPIDSDRDGIPDFVDKDSDNDGVLDSTEAWDIDYDGLPEKTRIGSDSDNDGLDDIFEGGRKDNGYVSFDSIRRQPIQTFPDSDGDLISNFRDYDDDNDMISTLEEDSNSNGDPTDDDDDDNGTPNFLDSPVELVFVEEISLSDFTKETSDVDTDGDGVTDDIDIDDDNDGILDEIEDLYEEADGFNLDKTPLTDFVSTKSINVSSDQLRLQDDENDIPHTLYYIVAREGSLGGIQPTIADSTLIRFEGQLLNGVTFDATTNFVWQQLPNTLRGYANGIAELKSGTEPIINNDGTSFYTDSGLGIIIMPSGLGYFLASPTTAIPSYSPLVFTVEVGNAIANTDADNDGVPSILEDLNGNGYLFDDNTDSESEASAGAFALANFQDSDDDDDGKPTRDEVEIDAMGNVTFPDSDNDGTPDYLDPDS